jgi:hypothetical protein
VKIWDLVFKNHESPAFCHREEIERKESPKMLRANFMFILFLKNTEMEV